MRRGRGRGIEGRGGRGRQQGEKGERREGRGEAGAGGHSNLEMKGWIKGRHDGVTDRPEKGGNVITLLRSESKGGCRRRTSKVRCKMKTCGGDGWRWLILEADGN